MAKRRSWVRDRMGRFAPSNRALKGRRAQFGNKIGLAIHARKKRKTAQPKR